MLPGAPMLATQGLAPETVALLARITTPPGGTRVGLINNLIISLKAAGVWSLLQAFYVYAAADTQSALLNWLSASNPTTVGGGSPTFTADRGYKGDGASYLSAAGIDPTTVGTGATNHSYGAWVNLDSTIGGVSIGGFGSTFLIVPNNLASAMSVNDYSSSSDTVTVTDGLGFSAISRSSSTGFDLQRNGSITTKTRAAGGSSGFTARVLCNCNGGGGPQNYMDGRVAAAYGAQALTQTQMQALYSALSTYLTAVGGA